MPDAPYFSGPAYEALANSILLELDAKAAQPERPKRSHAGMHASLGVMAGGQIADAVTTMAALKNPNLEEGNAGIYGKRPSAAKLLGIKAATMIPAAILLDKMHDKNPKLAKAAAIAVGTLGAIMAAKNAQTMRAHK